MRRLCYKPRAVAVFPPMPAAVPSNPVFCAIDRPDLEGALALVRAIAPHVGGVKLGLEFFAAQGPRGVEAVARLGLPIFLDLKLHDIPNTAAAAVGAVAASPTRPWLLGITVLTSLDANDLAATGVAAALDEQALRLGRLGL